MKIINAATYLDIINNPQAQSNTDITAENIKLSEQVKEIIRNVNQNGDQALKDYTKKFDNLLINQIKVPEQAINDAFVNLSLEKLDVFKIAIEQINYFQKKNLLQSWQEIQPDGTKLGQIVTPIDRVGVYIPGGKAAYPSSVIMNVVPAQIAGVKNIAVATPPSNNMLPNLDVLAVCHLLGVNEVYMVGGAQALAALALGTESIKKVDKICGPGNQFVTEAKKQLVGIVGIDSLAGPSEVMVYSDYHENKVKDIAYELLAQAEHDPLAKVTLITPSLILAEAVKKFIVEILNQQERKIIIKQALNNCSLVIVKDKSQAIEIINQEAPEHLVIIGQHDDLLKNIKNAGAIFAGDYATAVTGDYMAGPNHTIPTNRAARFSSPLSANDFVKTSSFVDLSEHKFKQLAPRIIRFADMEGLFAHTKVIKAKLDD
ncbi:MAG: histidinol dehydrogenase [SAR324 cluster bacterium]|nr:histidinol dehydrogenase [SAR324 cluster bacterium]